MPFSSSKLLFGGEQTKAWDGKSLLWYEAIEVAPQRVTSDYP